MASPPTANGVPANAQARVNGLVAADAAKARVYTFDPDASPQEKAAQAAKGRDQLKRVGGQNGGLQPAELAIDAGGSNIVPTITISDAEAEKPPVNPQPEGMLPDVFMPGEMPDGPAPTIPDWYKVGWRSVGGIDNELPEGEAKELSLLETFVDEQYYGDWYHNAALVFFAVFSSHFLTRFGFGWGWLFIILAICTTYYKTSMERLRRRVRDDIQRELVKSRLDSEHETADWINHFLERFWLIYEPVLSSIVVSSVDQVLSTNRPPFLDSLRLSTFTLGNKAPRIDKVRTFPRTADDIIMMDWSISFTPNDVLDLTPRQQQNKVNPKIVLGVKVGKGIGMSILLEDVMFSGHMRIRLKLMTNFPHVQIVDVSFLEPPVVDFVLKPLGGDTFGMDIAHIPGLQAFIRETLHSILGPMMYEPNVFTLNLEQMLSGAPLDTAIGVLQVTIDSARGIKGNKIGGGTPDPFVSVSINQRSELTKTKYKHNTYNPSWHETKFLLVNNLTESLIFTVWDYNDHRKNTELGQATFDLNKLNDDAVWEGQEVPIFMDGKDRGLLRFDVSFYPVLPPVITVEGAEEELPETNVGIVRLTLHQAKELDQSKSTLGDLNPFAKVFVGNNTTPQLATKPLKHTTTPVWDASTEFLCSDRKTSTITIKVIDDRDFLKDPVIGYMSVRLEDLLAAGKDASRDWWPLSNCKSGRVRLTAEWKPLNMAGSLHGADSYVPPIGVVRLHLEKATDVKNVEAALGGKSDPYVRVQVRNVTLGRTDVVNNNLNPVWDQIVYIPVHTMKETMMLECMDYQHLTKDRSLGSVELKVAELIEESENNEYPYASTGRKTVVDPIKLDKGGGYKGRLHYTAEFVPALALQGVKFDGGINEVQRAARDGQGDDDGDVVKDDNASSISSSDEDLPRGPTVRRPMGVSDARGHRKLGSEDTAQTDGTKAETAASGSSDSASIVSANGTMKTAEEEPPKGVSLTREELLEHQSGIIVCNVISGQLAKKARLEVLLDDGYWPAFSTIRPRSTHASWEYIGEGFIKELDFGRVWLRLNENEEGEKDDIIAEWKGDAKEFLEKTLSGPSIFVLTDQDEKSRSTIQIETRYVPVPVKLEPRESINNQGMLRVELVDGRDIHAADRGGKSDPFAVFSLNGSRVFKSQTKKKTLNPIWNETFVVPVPSRVGAEFEVELFDWNQIEQAKKLGSSAIELADLEPFQGVERTISLSHTKHGDKGELRVRLTFTPEIIAKSRKNTSTFSTAGRAMTQIGSLPLGGAKGVAHGVGKVLRHHNRSGSVTLEDGEGSPVIVTAPGQASQPIGGNGFQASLSSTAGGDNASISEVGSLRVTVLDAKDVSDDGDAVKPYVTLRVGDKEQRTRHLSKTLSPEWNETLSFTAGPMTPKLFVWIYEHKTLGKDKLLGEGYADIWRHIQQRGQTAAEVLVELRQGTGLLRLRLEFDADAQPLLNTSSKGSTPDLGSLSPSRFSMNRKRPTAQEQSVASDE